MPRRFPTGLTLGKIAAAVAAVAALGGVAYAATGSGFIDSSSHIDACLPPGGGQVHVWLPGHNCSGGWQSLAFAAATQAGPIGPEGATGPTGATGVTGAPNPSATTVDGDTVTKLQLREATPASSTTTQALYSGNGLTILANCDSTGSASLQANGPASADSELTVSGVEAGPTPFGSQTATLGSASLASLGPAGSGETSFSYATSSGTVVTGEIGYQHAPSFGSFAGCGFFGTVTAG